MRYQKRSNILGNLVRLNTSAQGLSLSVGVPGMRVNIPLLGKSRPPGYTIGVPGSGISHHGKLEK